MIERAVLAAAVEAKVLEYALNAAWQAPLVAGAAWAMVRVGRLGAEVEHRVWVAALGLCVVLPAWGLVVREAPRETRVAEASVGPDRAGDWAGTGAAVGAVVAVRPTLVHGEAGLRRAEDETVAAPVAAPVAASVRQPEGAGLPLAAPVGSAHGAARTERGVRRVWIVPKMGRRAQEWLAGLEGAAVAFGLLRLASRLLRARRLVSRGVDAAEAMPDWARAEWREYARRAVMEAPRVLVSDEVLSPVMVGWRRAALVVPEGFWERERDEVRAALLHEFAHAARRDWAVQVACEAVAAPVAWHPAVRAIGERIGRSREMVCDAAAAGGMGSELAYARCLVELARGMFGAEQGLDSGLGLGLLGSNVLEERVMRLMEQKRVATVRSQWVRAAGMVAVMTAASAGVAGFHVRPAMAAQAASAGKTVGARTSASPGTAVDGTGSSAAVGQSAGSGAGSGEAQGVSPPPVEEIEGSEPVAQVAPLPPLPQVAPLPPLPRVAPLAPLPSLAPVAPLVVSLPALAPVAPQVAVSPEVAAQGVIADGDATAQAGPGEHVHRWRDANGRLMVMVNGQVRELTPEERAKMERELREATARLRSPEFKKQMAEAAKAMADAQLHSPEFKAQMEAAQKQMAEATARFNSPEFRKQMADAARVMADAQLNSPEFKKQMEEARLAGLDAAAQWNSPEFRRQMGDAARAMADAGVEQALAQAQREKAKSASPEARAKMAAAEQELRDAQEKMQDAMRKMREAEAGK